MSCKAATVILVFSGVLLTVYATRAGEGSGLQGLDVKQTVQGYNQTVATENSCPTWFIKEKNGSCVCGKSCNNIVKCEKGSVRLLPGYCMTYVNGDGVVGHCLNGYKLHMLNTLYIDIPNSTDRLNPVMCGEYNRTGQLCGKCVEGLSVPVYSYDWACVQCSGNWLKYLTVVFVPLSVFFVVIVVFRINASSARLHGFVLYSQFLTLPAHMRVITVNFSGLGLHNYTKYIAYYSALTIYGIWNLDFFRLVYKPFCLYPQMTMLEAVALDYVVAVYPLVLILLTCLLMKLHDCNVGAIVLLGKPIRWFMSRLHRQFDIRMSLVDAFVTFFLLSYMKFVSISIDLLIPISPFNIHGKHLSHPYWFYDGTIEYMGSTHRPYALLAFAVLLVFVLFPVVVIMLYQFRCTHRRAVCRHFMGNSVHLFMDAIQGGYKDGTNGTRDCRYFPLVYLFLRVLLLFTYAMTLSTYFYCLAALMSIATAVLVAVTSPYKSTFYNKLDITLLQLLAALCAVTAFSFDESFKAPRAIAEFLYLVVAPAPLVFILASTVYWIIKQSRLAQAVRNILRRRNSKNELNSSFPHRLTHAQEYTPLLLDRHAADS